MEIDLAKAKYLKFISRSANKNNESKFIIDRLTYLIYGNNGTGKTTFAELIQEQLSDSYDVRAPLDKDKIVDLWGIIKNILRNLKGISEYIKGWNVHGN